MRHIPAIDGLRAVAVLAVVAYHAGLPVPAGFVGVDVFFVISGYLITRLLHDEIQATGRVDYLAFYARRARRILPALFLVVAVTAMAALWLLPETESIQTARAGAAALLFYANVFFSQAPTGYFDANPDSSPLLHLWSLGVEEQFYILWPAILMLARKRLVPVLVGLCLASFLLAEWWIDSGSGNAAFYQTPARAWELGLGAIIAVRPVKLPKGSAWFALGIVLTACFVPLGDFPGVGALPAVAASAVLIAAIQGGQRSPLLETKIMQAVGRVSYSLYLWHWPLLILLAPMNSGLAYKVFAGIVLPMGLAFVTYRYVESPVRRAKVLARQSRRTVMAGVLTIALGAGSLHATTRYMPTSGPAPSVNFTACHTFVEQADINPCTFGPADAHRTIVVIGDSVALQWAPAIYQIFDGWRIVMMTKSACPMADQPYFYPPIKAEYTACTEWRRKAVAFASAQDPDLIVMGSTHNYGFTSKQWIDGTDRIIRQLPDTAQVRIIRATPTIRPLEEGDLAFSAIKRAAYHFENVRVVDMNDLVCKGGCRPENYRDTVHLKEPFVASLSGALASRLEHAEVQ